MDTLAPALGRHAPIGFAFLDGHHDEEATIEYFQRIKEALDQDAVVVLDDVAWSAGMKRAWARIRCDPAVRVAIDLGPLALCVVNSPAEKRPLLTLVVV